MLSYLEYILTHSLIFPPSTVNYRTWYGRRRRKPTTNLGKRGWVLLNHPYNITTSSECPLIYTQTNAW